MKRAVCFLVFLAACINPLSPSETQRLNKAESKWDATGIRSYRYEMRTSCFCPNEILEWAVVEVRNGQIVSARSSNGTPLTGFDLDSRRTVEQLFDAARAYRPDWLASIDFQFDDGLGYPVRLVFTSKKTIADAGFAYEARNLVSLAD